MAARNFFSQKLIGITFIFCLEKAGGIDNKTLLEPEKRQPAAEARAVAALLVQENNYTALTDLGKLFSRDLRAAGRIRERLQNDAELQGRIKRIKIKLEQMSKCQA